MVPGFVTSGLEVWGGKECARKHFRQRLWATLVGARSFLMETECWLEHMSLDPITGGDPEGIRLRASSGFEAADYFHGKNQRGNQVQRKRNALPHTYTNNLFLFLC